MGNAIAKRSIGRPRSIDRDRIVAAANRIGAERLTMRAVAEDLGVTTQALYNHIGGRRELLALLANDYGDVFEVPDTPGEPWQDWLCRFAHSLRIRLLERPGTASAVATRGPTSSPAVSFVDRTITKMAVDGFEPSEALVAYKAVLELVIGMVQRQEVTDADAERDHGHRALFYEALANSDPEALHNLAFIAAGWTRRDPSELFDYSLVCLISGIASNKGYFSTVRS